MQADKIVRKAFHERVLWDEHSSMDTLVVDELGLGHGTIRADIAVLNGKLVGYEIKTDKDNLVRLPAQIDGYNEVFEKIYIISGIKHLEKVKRMVPKWWGIYLIEKRDEAIHFIPVRKGQTNKKQTSIGIAQLLWKEEVLEILRDSFKIAAKRSHDKETLYAHLTSVCSTKILSKLALRKIKLRDSWRISQQLL